jgi:AraC-like DNA-binding protein
MRKLLLITWLLSASLFCDAKIVVPDSMLTIHHAYHTTSADTSLVIIQTMRERQLAPTWMLDLAEGDYCFATMDYTKALEFFQRVYDTPDKDMDDVAEMGLLTRLMQTHDILYNEAELATFIHELRQKALRCKNNAYLSMADFTIGKRTHYHRKRQEGYDICIKALEMMKGSDYFRKDTELCRFYADLLLMYTADELYDDALRMSLLQEEAVRRVKGPKVKNKETLRHVYAMRASMLAKAGRKDEADIAYAEWKKESDDISAIDKFILDYLIINKHYEEARDIIHELCHTLKSQKDNYSYRMITMLTTAAQVEAALGNSDEAARHCQEIRTIADSLHIDKSENLMKKTWNLIETEENAKKITFILNALGLLFVIGIAIGAMVLYYTRRIRHSNKRLLAALNGLEAYRNTTMEPNSPTNPISSISPNDPIGPISPSGPISPTGSTALDDNERLFVKLDSQITRDRLFLKPNFGRDDMARLIGVDKNRIGHIMSKYSEASNASVYINTKRVEYGAKLLLMHPEYTIAAIATECGMTNTVTFNRTFREVYGMTPSEYRTKYQ